MESNEPAEPAQRAGQCGQLLPGGGARIPGSETWVRSMRIEMASPSTALLTLLKIFLLCVSSCELSPTGGELFHEGGDVDY